MLYYLIRLYMVSICISLYTVFVGIIWYHTLSHTYCIIWYYTLLHCTIIYYTILYCTILYGTIAYYTVLYYVLYSVLYNIILYYNIIYSIVPYYTVLYYTILYYTVLYYSILYCTILSYIALFYSIQYYFNIHIYVVIYNTILYYTHVGPAWRPPVPEVQGCLGGRPRPSAGGPGGRARLNYPANRVMMELTPRSSANRVTMDLAQVSPGGISWEKVPMVLCTFCIKFCLSNCRL